MTLVQRPDLFTDPVTIARFLLGTRLVSESEGHRVTARIVETEAYRGQADPASHAFRGPTARNRVMFGPPGCMYVYLIYGLHFCANVSCSPEGEAGAVLLRAGEITGGSDVAARRRGPVRSWAQLARGPACLTKALGISRSHDGIDLLDSGSMLQLCRQPPQDHEPRDIGQGPRVGVSRAAAEPWRFWLVGSPAVSAYRAASPRRRGR